MARQPGCGRKIGEQVRKKVSGIGWWLIGKFRKLVLSENQLKSEKEYNDILFLSRLKTIATPKKCSLQNNVVVYEIGMFRRFPIKSFAPNASLQDFNDFFVHSMELNWVNGKYLTDTITQRGIKVPDVLDLTGTVLHQLCYSDCVQTSAVVERF